MGYFQLTQTIFNRSGTIPQLLTPWLLDRHHADLMQIFTPHPPPTRILQWVPKNRHSPEWPCAWEAWYLWTCGFFQLKKMEKTKRSHDKPSLKPFYGTFLWHLNSRNFRAESHTPPAQRAQQIVVVEFMRRKLAFVFKELQVGFIEYGDKCMIPSSWRVNLSWKIPFKLMM